MPSARYSGMTSSPQYCPFVSWMEMIAGNRNPFPLAILAEIFLWMKTFTFPLSVCGRLRALGTKLTRHQRRRQGGEGQALNIKETLTGAAVRGNEG